MSFEIEIKKVKTIKGSRPYVNIVTNQGNAQLNILFFGSSFDVQRTVNGKRSALASPIGKTFWEWNDVANHYKQFTSILKEETNVVAEYIQKLTKLK